MRNVSPRCLLSQFFDGELQVCLGRVPVKEFFAHAQKAVSAVQKACLAQTHLLPAV